MIALVDLEPATQCVGVEALPVLPAPPALKWSAFIVRFGGAVAFPEGAAWGADVRTVRPRVPIGIVWNPRPDESRLLAAMARSGLTFSPVLASCDAPRGFVPTRLIQELRSRAVEHLIVRDWVEEWRLTDPQILDLITAVAAHGVRGGKASTLKIHGRSRAGLSHSSVASRLADAGLPTLGRLLKQARVLAVGYRVQHGMSLTNAVVASGFTDVKLYRKARGRQKWGPA